MTLVWGLVYGPKELWYGAVYSTLASLALLFPALRTDERLWFAILCANAMHLVPNWYHLFNDFFLFSYWVLAIFIALSSKQLNVLSRAAQWLLGLTFAFATLWKVLSPNFLSGDFMVFHFLYNYYFASLTEILSPLSRQDILANAHRLPLEVFGQIEERTVSAISPANLTLFARVVTFGAVIIEGTTAVLFLLPTKRLQLIRNIALSLFIVVGYIILPVASLGVLLSVLAFSQASSAPLRAWYLFTFFALQLFFFRVDLLFRL